MFLGDEDIAFGLLAPPRHGARRPRRSSTISAFALPAGAVLSIADHRPAATRRDGARRDGEARSFSIFDEPTAYLTRQEAAQLFALIRRLKANGVTIVYISHRLEEVFELCRPRVGAARRRAGRHARGSRRPNEAEPHPRHDQPHDRADLPQGRRCRSGDRFSRRESCQRRGLHGCVAHGRAKARSSGSTASSAPAAASSCSACSAASRRSRRANLVAGRDSLESAASAEAMELGIALLPESRRDQGLCLNLGVGFNLNLPIFERLSRGPLINPGREAAAADGADRRRPHHDGLAQRARLEPLRRQPAEGGDRQMAQSRRQAVHIRRADGRRRRRHQGGDLSRCSPICCADGRRHHPDLVLSARGLRAGRHAARLPRAARIVASHAHRRRVARGQSSREAIGV